MTFDGAPAAIWPAARPIVKWTGGKSAELDEIKRYMPVFSERIIEPFLGGGAVTFAVPGHIPAVVNDMSTDLVRLYSFLKIGHTGFMALIHAIEKVWTDIDRIDTSSEGKVILDEVVKASRPVTAILGACFSRSVAKETAIAIERKTRFIARLEAKGETVKDPSNIFMSAAKGGLYTALRAAYNSYSNPVARTALFWFMREFCYGGMFRTNSKGGFNVPYGGASYNGRSLKERIEQVAEANTRARLNNMEIHRGDFSDFFKAVQSTENDFVFLDPPYDSPFSTYDNNSFSRDDHRRLAADMAAMKAKWMMVISETEFVRNTYCTMPGVHTVEFGKRYQGNIKNRVDGNVTHLLITNYPTA